MRPATIRRAFSTIGLGLALATAVSARAALPCAGAYVADDPLLGTDAARVVLGDGTMDLAGCGRTSARATVRPAGVRVKAIFRTCAGVPGQVRVVATVDPSDCTTLTGVLRARRAGVRTRFTATATGAIAGHVSLASPAASAGIAAAPSADDADADFAPDEMIVRFRDDAGTPARFAVAGADAERVHGNPHGRGGGLFELHHGPRSHDDARRATLDAVQAMRARADVLWAQPNYRRHALRVPNDPLFGLQWHYPMISLPEAWDVTIGSSDVVVAVIDTGLLTTHPDIAPERLVPGFDFISDPDVAGDGDGIDADPFDVGDGGAGAPSSFHGTHVTGTIGAAADNGIGVTGIDWNARLMPLRALGRGGGSDFDIAQAIRFAAGLDNVSGRLPAQRADVVNMSLGGRGVSPAMHEAIQDARAAGTIVVVAAGNDAEDAAGSSPAAFPEVVCVSAVDIAGRRTFYTNFGTVVDIAAPGGDTRADTDGDGFVDGVLSTLGDDSSGSIVPVLGFLQGTSMATPHVTGVVALMQASFMAAHGGARMTPDDFDAFLASGALTDAIGPDDFSGHGLVNARKAVLAAANAAPPAGGDDDAGGGAGPGTPERIVVLLLDPDTQSVLAERDADAAGDFRFDDVRAGRRLVAAGTDRDGDGEIGDTGELFGVVEVEVGAGAETRVELPVLVTTTSDATAIRTVRAGS